MNPAADFMHFLEICNEDNSSGDEYSYGGYDEGTPPGVDLDEFSEDVIRSIYAHEEDESVDECEIVYSVKAWCELTTSISHINDTGHLLVCVIGSTLIREDPQTSSVGIRTVAFDMNGILWGELAFVDKASPSNVFQLCLWGIPNNGVLLEAIQESSLDTPILLNVQQCRATNRVLKGSGGTSSMQTYEATFRASQPELVALASIVNPASDEGHCRGNVHDCWPSELSQMSFRDGCCMAACESVRRWIHTALASRVQLYPHLERLIAFQEGREETSFDTFHETRSSEGAHVSDALSSSPTLHANGFPSSVGFSAFFLVLYQGFYVHNSKPTCFVVELLTEQAHVITLCMDELYGKSLDLSLGEIVWLQYATLSRRWGASLHLDCSMTCSTSKSKGMGMVIPIAREKGTPHSYAQLQEALRCDEALHTLRELYRQGTESTHDGLVIHHASTPSCLYLTAGAGVCTIYDMEHAVRVRMDTPKCRIGESIIFDLKNVYVTHIGCDNFGYLSAKCSFPRDQLATNPRYSSEGNDRACSNRAYFSPSKRAWACVPYPNPSQKRRYPNGVPVQFLDAIHACKGAVICAMINLTIADHGSIHPTVSGVSISLDALTKAMAYPLQASTWVLLSDDCRRQHLLRMSELLETTRFFMTCKASCATRVKYTSQGNLPVRVIHYRCLNLEQSSNLNTF